MCKGVHQGALARVGVADEGDGGQALVLSGFTMLGAAAADILQLAFEPVNAVADEAAIRFKLRFAGASRADSASEPLQVAPLPSNAWQQVLMLGQCDL